MNTARVKAAEHSTRESNMEATNGLRPIDYSGFTPDQPAHELTPEERIAAAAEDAAAAIQRMEQLGRDALETVNELLHSLRKEAA